jgi:HEAT repeat protein
VTNPDSLHALLSDDFLTRELAKEALIAGIDELLPRLAELVHDPRYRQKYHQHVLTPLHELLEVLRKAGRSEAIPALGSLLDDPDVEFRREAARTLGNLGHDECIPWLRMAFADPDGRVRSAALGDLMYAAEKPTCSDAFRRALAEDVMQFLRHPEQEES